MILLRIIIHWPPSAAFAATAISASPTPTTPPRIQVVPHPPPTTWVWRRCLRCLGSILRAHSAGLDWVLPRSFCFTRAAAREHTAPTLPARLRAYLTHLRVWRNVCHHALSATHLPARLLRPTAPLHYHLQRAENCKRTRMFRCHTRRTPASRHRLPLPHTRLDILKRTVKHTASLPPRNLSSWLDSAGTRATPPPAEHAGGTASCAHLRADSPDNSYAWAGCPRRFSAACHDGYSFSTCEPALTSQLGTGRDGVWLPAPLLALLLLRALPLRRDIFHQAPRARDTPARISSWRLKRHLPTAARWRNAQLNSQ